MNETSPPVSESTLAGEYPAYVFTSDPSPDGQARSYTAQAKTLDTSPWCMVTTDPEEFHEHLARLS